MWENRFPSLTVGLGLVQWVLERGPVSKAALLGAFWIPHPTPCKLLLPETPWALPPPSCSQISTGSSTEPVPGTELSSYLHEK